MAVQDFMKMGYDRRKAIAMVARTQPALHRELLEGDPRNAKTKIQELIAERFEGTPA